ncbi:MAG: YeeE/YedE family protein [Verrucomicrobiota bacterium]|nr:YeeE/YedE family protein [Verrucomicrobiota bacterium]
MKKGSAKPEAAVAPPAKIFFALVAGLIFGFLLQKGGAAKFNILIGQLLLQDWTVAKIMLSAIVVGMLGIYPLHRAAKVNLHLKPTRPFANIVGGLVFGAGFALIGYCPGTAAAALGQGNWDALFGMTGLVVGSYIYAEMSGWLKGGAQKWGDLGKITLPDAIKVPRLPFAIGFALFLAGCLFALEKFTVR